MKKKLIAATSTLILTLACGSVSFAATVPAPMPAPTTVYGCPFVDANGDGICDNGDFHCPGYVDANNDGICDYGDAHCSGFWDFNRDGVCDTCWNQMSHNGNCYSNGLPHGNHAGHRIYSSAAGTYSAGTYTPGTYAAGTYSTGVYSAGHHSGGHHRGGHH